MWFSDGALWFTTGSDSIGRITTTGVFSYYVDPRIVRPIDIATGSDGALWFTSLSNTIGRIDTAGVVTIFTDPDISWAYRIAAGPDGVLWFTNLGNGRIGRITTNGQVSTYGDPRIVAPYGITAGPDGSVWFTDTGNNAIGRISSTGEISIYTDPGISGPFDITAGTDGAVWFNNVNNSTIGRLAVSVDTTPPTATASATSNGEPYSAGTWTRHDVVVHFTCTDADSGVASVTPDQTVSSEGTGQSVAGTCTDNAGNGTSTTFVNIEIDKTTPAVTYLEAAASL